MTGNDRETRMIAAELVFGLVKVDETETLRRVVATDPVFASSHEQWMGIAAGLSANLTGNASVNLWKRIRKDVQSEIQRCEVLRAGNRRAERALLAKRFAAGFALCCLLVPFAAQLTWSPAARAPSAKVATPAAGPQLPISAHLVGEGDFGTVFIDLEKREMTTMLARAPSSNLTYELWLIGSSVEPRSLGIELGRQSRGVDRALRRFANQAPH